MSMRPCMRCDLESIVISQFHSRCHIRRVNTVPYTGLFFFVGLSIPRRRRDLKTRGINEQLFPSKSEKKAFQTMRCAEDNPLRTEKESSFGVSSIKSLDNILPKIQDQCVAAVVTPWRIVVHILVWAIILKKERGKKVRSATWKEGKKERGGEEELNRWQTR